MAEVHIFDLDGITQPQIDDALKSKRLPLDIGTEGEGVDGTVYATPEQLLEMGSTIGSTQNSIARIDPTAPKKLKGSIVTLDDLGNIENLTSLKLSTPVGAPATAGILSWNADEETADLQLNDAFTLHLGEQTIYHVKNTTGSTIAKGAPVMFYDTTGNSGKIIIQPWNGTGPSSYFMGLTAEAIQDDEEGFVIAFGKLRGIQTNGGNYGETWLKGDIIYANNSTGSLTKVQPPAPNPHITVCAVIHPHATNGILFVRPTLGSNIKNDEGVTITSLTSGQLLIANSAGTVLENKSISGDATLANTGALTLANTAVNPASYTSANITVDSKGRITAASNGGNAAWTIVTTTNFNLVAGGRYQVDTSVSAFGLIAILPASPVVGQEIILEDAKLTWGTKPIVIQRNGKLMNGITADYSANVSGGKINFVFISESYGWSVK
jgi:hypothetical protein